MAKEADEKKHEAHGGHGHDKKDWTDDQKERAKQLLRSSGVPEGMLNEVVAQIIIIGQL